MADGEANSIANRDEAIPVIRIEDDDASDTSDAESEVTARRRDRLRERASRSTSRLREKFEGDSESGRQSLQDRLFASVLSQILPAPPPDLNGAYNDSNDGDDDGQDGSAPRKKDRRSKKYVDKPEFGPRLM